MHDEWWWGWISVNGPPKVFAKNEKSSILNFRCDPHVSSHISGNFWPSRSIKVTQPLPAACAAPISIHTWGRDRDVNYVPCLCINRVRPTIVLTSFNVSFMLFWNIPPLNSFWSLFCCTRVFRYVAFYSRACVSEKVCVCVKHSMFLSLLKKRDFHIVPDRICFIRLYGQELRRNSVRRYIRERYHGWVSNNDTVR